MIIFFQTLRDPRPWITALRMAFRSAGLSDRIRLYPTNDITRTVIKEDEQEIDAQPISPEDVKIAVLASPPHGLLARFPNLELMLSFWAGVDNLLADPEFPKTVPLIRLVDPRMSQAMAESATMHVLCVHRQLHDFLDLQKQNVWEQKPRGMFQPLPQHRTITILGLGEMGLRTAAALQPFGFRLLGWSRSPKTVPGMQCFSGAEGLETALTKSDILICLLPLTHDTRGIINARNLALMPRGSAVMNFARGAHVVDQDLIAALDSKHIDRAFLDVFHTEPLPASSPLWAHPRVIVTPHVSAETEPTTASAIIANAINRWVNGPVSERGSIPGLVIHERGY